MEISASNTYVDRALAVDAQAPGQLKAGARRGDRDAVMAAATQFEAVFIEQMMRAMRSTVPESELWNSDQTKFFQGMADQQMASGLAGKSGFGLAELLTQQMMRTLVAEGQAKAKENVSPSSNPAAEKAQV